MNDALHIPRILLLPGEPAGIGPDICLAAAHAALPVEIITIADPALLRARAQQLQCNTAIVEGEVNFLGKPTPPKTLRVLPRRLPRSVKPGVPSLENAHYLLESIDMACALCLEGEADAMVTAPLHKAVINQAGIPFSGHTDYIASKAGGYPIMMLANDILKVCIVTAHVPLKSVPQLLSKKKLRKTIICLNHEMGRRFGINKPTIMLTGLNPHAGEEGYLGEEEKEIIEPVIRGLQKENIQVTGPVPADTAFIKDNIDSCDVIVAMYHDQGLAAIKALDFWSTVNITLGLPLIRTSVDHGTAFHLAGTTKANSTSLKAAIRWASRLAIHEKKNQN